MRPRFVALLPLAAAFLPACAGPSGRIHDAEKLYAQGEYFQAWHLIEEVRAEHPTDPEVQRAYWRIRLAHLLKEGQRACFANDEQLAIEEFEKALVLDPDNEIAQAWIRKCKEKLAHRAAAEGRRLAMLGDLENALIQYHEALVHQPGNAEAEEGLRKLAERWRRTQDEAQDRYLQGVRALAEQLFRQTRYHLLIALDKDPTLEEAVAPNERAHRLLMQERYAEAKDMEAEGHFGPALREYEAVREAFPNFPDIDQRIERARAEAKAADLADDGEMAVYRGEYARARELLQEALALTQQQKGDISERLLLVHEREASDRYFAAKDLELQYRYEDALAAYRELDDALPGYEDVRARINDIEIRVEEAKSAYEAATAAEEAGDVESAITGYTDALLFWPGYRDAESRLERLRNGNSPDDT